MTQTADFTLSAWVYINAAPTGNKEILSWESTDNNSLYLGISTGSTSSNATLNFGSTFSTVLEDQYIGSWVEITAIKTATDTILYLNGTLLVKKGSAVTFTTPSNLVVGSNVNNSEFFNGKIAQVKIYNRSLTSSEVYQNFRATCGTFNQDHDALSFINAAGLTSSTQINAVNRLVRDLKANKLWSKLRVVYPFVGGSAAAHKFNLKDPRDLDAAYRLTFAGGWTHSSTGALPNGTSGWANTNYNPSIDALNSSDLHLSYYSRTNNDNGGVEIGAQSSSALQLYLELKSSNYTYVGTNNTYNQPYGGSFIRFASTTSAGNFIYNKYSSKYDYLYRDGQYVGYLGMANAYANDPVVNKQLYLGAHNNGTTASNFSSREVAFASIGQSLSETEIFVYNIIVQKYQTALSRQIGASYSTINHNDPDIDLFLNNAQITDSTQQNAIEKLVRSIKYEGIWNSTLATYPFVGGSAGSHRFNLVSYKFTLTFGGGWTHTSTGALPNGTNAYASPGILASQYLSANTGHFGFYTRSDKSTGTVYVNSEYDVMAFDNTNYLGIQSRLNSRLCGHLGGGTHYSSSIDPKESTGFSFVMRGAIAGSASTRIYLMKNDTLDYVDSAVEGFAAYTIPARYIGLAGTDAGDGNGWRYFSSREHSFTTIGKLDMTQIQAIKYGRIVQRYQEQLNRSAVITDMNYSTGEGYVKIWYDQTSSGKNLVMNTRASQPKIYTAGAVITDDNGKTAIQFDGWNDAMFTTKTINFQNVGSIIAVNSGTASGIQTQSNNTTIMSTTYGTYMPSAYTWTANGRHDNQRMPIRTFGDNTSQACSIAAPYWSGTTGTQFGGQFAGYSLSGATLVKSTGVGISSFYLNGTTTQISNNFSVDTSSASYNSTYAASAGSLLIGGLPQTGGFYMSKMKYQEILVFDKSYSISNKLEQEKNMYDYYTPFSYNIVSDSDANKMSLYTRLSVTQSAAINTLVSGMKTAGLWDKMVAVYPVISGNPQGHAFNLKNISFDSGAWTLSHAGGITHDSTGMAYNGTNATSVIYKALSDNFAPNNFHMSFYISGGTLVRASGYPQPLIYSGGTNINTGLEASATVKSYGNYGPGQYISVTNSTMTGYFIGTSIVQSKLFRNGALLGTSSISATMSNGYKGSNQYGSGGVPHIHVASDFGVGSFENVKTGFMTLGYGLTDTEVSNLSTLVLAYQTALGR